MDGTINLEETIERKRGGRKTHPALIALLKKFLCIDYINNYCKQGKTGLATENIECINISAFEKPLAHSNHNGNE